MSFCWPFTLEEVQEIIFFTALNYNKITWDAFLIVRPQNIST